MVIKKVKNAGCGGHEIAAQPIVTASDASSLRESVTLRLPDPGERCPLSGLSRTTIIEHGEAGDFKLIRLRKPGSKRGVVLLDTKTFLAWLHGLPGVERRQS